MKSDRSEEALVHLTIKIDGMDCVACCITIDGDLEELDGVKKAQTNFAKGECHVEYDAEKIKPELLLKTIQKSGYNASLVNSPAR